MNNKTIIIAEAGVNHNGDITLAKKLVDIASEAGADIVKFQTFKAERQVTHWATKADYQKITTKSNESQLEMLSRLQLSKESHIELIKHCKSRKINFLSTGFDIESIDLLKSLGQAQFKIPSGEITNLPYLRYVGNLKKTVILSTGMANLGEVEAAIEVLEQSGTPRTSITVLHCSTEYPAPFNEVNLMAMQTIKSALGVRVGYSDHTEGIEIPIAAVALGASIIEKHFTVDRNLPGPDHQASLGPRELTAMVKAIRNVELAIGDGIKRITKSEIKNKDLVRKSIVASQEITAGERFSTKNITTKRPGNGISPMRWDAILGKKAQRNYIKDELIDEND